MNDTEKVTPISYDCKRLLLRVLTTGYITEEQKSELAAFFDVRQMQVCCITSKSSLEEIERIYNEITEEATRRGILPPNMVQIKT